MSKHHCDFLIIGGGIIGVSIALSLKKSYSEASIVVLEKEPQTGLHASGRNSGVIHAGFYYTADSLKARFTREGNRTLREFCKERRLAINQCGKLVVARNETENKVLDTLLERGKHNGVELEMLTLEEARQIEPQVKSWQRVLYSPTTASVDPVQVLATLVYDASNIGIKFQLGAKYLEQKDFCVKTSSGDFEAGYIINTAGLYADKVANDFGFGGKYHLLPFKGIYLCAEPGMINLHTHIYPVPDLRNPFLGVHFTLTAHGKVKIGPTAIPAFWPEQYGWISNFRLDEFLQTSGRHLKLILHSDPMFRDLAIEEIKKYSQRYLVSEASLLMEGIDKDSFKHWSVPGIRAQLVNKQTQKLEMDFILEGDNKSMHVLNAVSPAFTCASPFADYVVEQINQKLS